MQRKPLLHLLTACVLSLFVLPAYAQFKEDFQNVGGLAAKGWVFQNNSDPAPSENHDWGQGNTDVFFDRMGVDDSYIAASYESVGEPNGTISNWLLTPTLNLSNGDPVRFYTRTTDGAFPDRLQVRLSLNGASTNVGSTAVSVGDFTTTLLTINPNLLPGPENYPTTFTQFAVTLVGLPTGINRGRIAFRYFVTNAGLVSPNADYIGIDTFQVGETPPAPEPSPLHFILVGGMVGIWVRHLRRTQACSSHKMGNTKL